MTTRIQVSDSGLEVIPPRDTLTQGSENTLLLEFEFSGQWLLCNEYNAVFTDGINSATVPVTGGACVIPVEVLQNPWRFVSLSLNGTSASGVITSPFVRIGQVLPSAIGGEGGKFVTMAQLMEILQGYVNVKDLDIYVTQDDIARLDELKADETTVAALSATVAANTAAIATKAAASDLQALETTVAGKADASALDDYETAAHAAATYETKADASQIKSISYGGTAVAPDATGEVALSKSEITVATNPTSPPSKTFRLTAADGNIFSLLLADDATLARLGFVVGSETASVEVATQTWVREYVASLDGTNIAV